MTKIEVKPRTKRSSYLETKTFKTRDLFIKLVLRFSITDLRSLTLINTQFKSYLPPSKQNLFRKVILVFLVHYFATNHLRLLKQLP